MVTVGIKRIFFQAVLIALSDHRRIAQSSTGICHFLTTMHESHGIFKEW